MPIYEFKCGSCGYEESITTAISGYDELKKKWPICPVCDKALMRRWSGISTHIK